ncbi:MAG: hypothetical protein L0287_04505, partial [Anaerolineae bacterium]|nr:hypothetical protein [Anaerolineae bacterium]
MVSLRIVLLIIIPSLAFSQAHIYRSMQVGKTSALATGSGNNLTISSGTATFASPLPDTIGIGDAVQYDDDSDGDIDANDSICFISGRTSSTSLTVKNAAGTNPTDVTNDQDWSIFRSYTGLANAESGTENTGIDADLRAFDAGNVNLVSGNLVWHFALYRGQVNEALTIDGWTTGSSNYMRWFTPYLSTQVGTSQRHSGVLNRRA